MSAFDDGIAVLRIAAAAGNRPAKAVLDELDFRETRIATLHEAVEAMRQSSEVKAVSSGVFCGDFVPGVTRATAIRQVSS
jgi:hypothetical protein